VTGKLIWVSPTTIRVNRLVEVDRGDKEPNHQPCNCEVCRNDHNGAGTLAASLPVAGTSLPRDPRQ
jgi:hypothetical protein